MNLANHLRELGRGPRALNEHVQPQPSAVETLSCGPT